MATLRRLAAAVLAITVLSVGCTRATEPNSSVSAQSSPGGRGSGTSVSAPHPAGSGGNAAVVTVMAQPSAPAPDDGEVGLVARSAVTVFGYLIRTPGPSAASVTAYPTIVFLHGFGERGDGSTAGVKRLEDTGLPNLAATHQLPVTARPFLILAPQTDDQSWNPALVHLWLAEMMRRHRIDPHHLYLTGVSMGGGGVVAYLDAYGRSAPFAAAAPISGDWTPPGSVMGLPSCDRLSTTPIWAFAGDIDDVVPHQFSINLVAFLNRHCRLAEPDRLTLYQGRFHDVWTHTYDLTGQQDEVDPPWQPYTPDLYTWFLQHHRL